MRIIAQRNSHRNFATAGEVEYAGISVRTSFNLGANTELPCTPGWEVFSVVCEASGGCRAGERVAALTFLGE